MLPILSYGAEVWGVQGSFIEAAEALHRSFLKQLLGIWKSTTDEIVLAELGRFPLQIHLLQQVCRYLHRTVGLDNTCLVTLAMMKGFGFYPDGMCRCRAGHFGIRSCSKRAQPLSSW